MELRREQTWHNNFQTLQRSARHRKESVSAEQGQQLRAAESHQCVLNVKAKPCPETPTQGQRDIHELTHLLRAAESHQCVLNVKAKPCPETPTQRQRDIHDLTHLPPVSWCPGCVSGKTADDPHRRRKDARDSGLDVASCDHCDISAEVGTFNQKLKFKLLVSPRSVAVATLEGPKDVTEHLVRFVCDMLETWGFVCVSSSVRTSQQRPLCRTLFVRTRQFKTIPRNMPRYSHGSLCHCESATKEVKKQIRAMLFQMYADYNCNSDKFPTELPISSWMVRHAAWTLTRYALKADGRTSFSSW